MVGEVISIGASRGAAATKNRILDAAEALFMEHGFEATSLRAITAAAEANLAAVNYHFGSKEELFQAVLTRRLDPMNQERVALLDALEARSRRPARCPASRSWRRCSSRRCKLARDPARGGTNFLRLLGRAYADPAPFIRHFLSEQYAEMIGALQGRVRAARCRSCRSSELSWRLHFIMGALSYTLAGTDALKLIAEITPAKTATTKSCCTGWRRSCWPACNPRPRPGRRHADARRTTAARALIPRPGARACPTTTASSTFPEPWSP